MKNLILFDDDSRDQLLPLTHTRPVCELRCGILTIREKWEKVYNTKASYITQDHLQEKFPIHVSDDNLLINGVLLPNARIIKLINSLGTNEAIIYDGELIAARLDYVQFQKLNADEPISEIQGLQISEKDGYKKISHLWDIFRYNFDEIEADFKLLTKNRESEKIHVSNTTFGKYPIFLEKGAKVMASTINSENGPVYIGKDAEIMEGCLIRGPFAMNNNATLKMGAKIYGGTTLGPHCKVGGEVNNVVFTGYSNKGHDGFLGNSVIGEWCNFGADSNNSNLKNNYDEVKLWSYKEEKFVRSGLQFCGLIMGDHSKCGINTMFNTGTVIGAFCNIYGSGFPRNFVPSFSWGGPQGYTTYRLNKAFATAERVMNRRDIEITELDKTILKHIFEEEESYRSWE